MLENQKVIVLTEIAILTALALALDAVAYFYSFTLFPNGGSISLAMLPIIVVALRRGVVPGIVTGILVGALQTIWFTPFIAPLNPVLGYLLDYPLGYGLVGLAGLSRKLLYHEKRQIVILGLVLGSLCGGISRTISVTVSGVYCWTTSWWASIVYNFPYMIPSIIMCTIMSVLLYLAYAKIYLVDSPTSKFKFE